MERFCSLYSSSSGNCTYIGSGDSGILIDIGVSAKRTADALLAIGVDPSSIRSAFITHEHSDHINGVRVFAKRFGTTVYASRGTLDGMNSFGIFSSGLSAYIMPSEGTETDGFYVRPFRLSHDANEPTGYTVVTPNGKRIGIATDTGVITEETASALFGCDLVLLESNHDVNMLRMGSYPYPLKMRILSDVGHLSNEVSAAFAADLVDSGTKHLVLGHLSKENNLPYLAFETAKSTLSKAGFTEGEDYFLTVAGDLNDPIIL